MKKFRGLSIICAIFLVLSLVGCSASPNESLKGDGFYQDEMEYDSMNGASMDSSMDDYLESPSEESTGNDLDERKIIKNAKLNFETELYDKFIIEMEQCISSYGGYVESSEVYGGAVGSSRARSSYVTARIPQSQYNRFMTEICGIGTLTYKTETADDVTMSYVDMESRVKSLQTEYDALIEILAKATSLNDVIQLQSRISDVTYQIESFKAQLRKYDNLVAYCTVRINVTEVKKVAVDEEELTFGDRISDGLSESLEDIA